MGKKIENKDMIKQIKEERGKKEKEKNKDIKKFKDMTQKDKDELLELIAKDLGYDV